MFRRAGPHDAAPFAFAHRPPILLFLVVSKQVSLAYGSPSASDPPAGLMSTESKTPREFGPLPEYKTHFELWSEASRDIGDAAAASSNGRRVWTKPVLFVRESGAPAKREPAAPRLAAWSRSYPTLAAVAGAMLLVVLSLGPWKSSKDSSRPANIAARLATNVAPSPQAIPSPAIIATSADAAPVEQLAATQIVASTDDPLESPSVGNDEPAEAPQPVKKMHLESSIRSELAREGLSGIGVSVAGYGDVFLNGTFFSRADERRATAMVRANKGVRNIYFSGAVRDDNSSGDEQGTVASQSSASTTLASAGPQSQGAPRYLQRIHYRERVSRLRGHPRSADR